MKILFKTILATVIICGTAISSWGITSVPQEGKNRSFLRGDVLEVNIRDAGTFHEYLRPGEEKRVRCIRLSGVMNGDDAKDIKNICRRSSACDENGRSVDNYVDLELENVRIVGGGSYSNRTEHDAIAREMFENCYHLRYVSLPRDLRYIGDEAFDGCSSLEEVRFVGRSNIREIGNEAFKGCSRLTRINLPNSIETLGDQCFDGCSSLRRIDLPSSLHTIGKEAFCDAGLTSVKIPYNVTYMGSNAFKGTNITSLYIPQGMEVENDSFGNLPKLVEFQVERGNRYYTVEDGVLYNIDGNILIYYPNAKNGGFSVPNGVTAIKNGAFANCGSLTSVTFPTSLTEIGKNAFLYCSSLRNVEIPKNVTSIGQNAFSGCSHMTTATIDARITVLAAEAFKNCSSLQSLVLPDGLEKIGESAFENCKSLQNIEWGNSLHTIMKEAFKKCGFINLELPDGITTIGENALRDCKSLQSIVFPNELKVLDKELMRGCEKLTQVTLPEQLTTIGENAFRDCKALPAVELPEGITTINNNAFRGTALTQLTLPASITKIGDKIVEKCKMQSITCYAAMPPVLDKVSDKKTTLYVPAGSVDAYKNTKPWKDFKNILPIE